MRSNLRNAGVDHRRNGTEGFAEQGTGLVRRLAGNVAKNAKRRDRTTIPQRAGAFASGRTVQPMSVAIRAAAKERAESFRNLR